MGTVAMLLSLLLSLAPAFAHAANNSGAGKSGPFVPSVPSVSASPALGPSAPLSGLGSGTPSLPGAPSVPSTSQGGVPAAPAASFIAPLAPSAVPGSAPSSPLSRGPAATSDAAPAPAAGAASRQDGQDRPAEHGADGSAGRGQRPSARAQAESAVQGKPEADDSGYETVFDGSREAPAAPARLEDPSEIFYQHSGMSEHARAYLGNGRQFAQGASELLHQDSFIPGGKLLDGMEISGMRRDSAGELAFQAAREVLDFAGRAPRDEHALAFVTALGRYAAQRAYASRTMGLAGLLSQMMSGGADRQRTMPDNPLKAGEFWDFAAGINAGDFIIAGLDPATTYVFLDLSDFVLAYLGEIARLVAWQKNGAANVRVVKGDALKARPKGEVAVLRSKNVTTYVPGFEKALAKMVEQIAPGGMLLIQNDPGAGQRAKLIDDLGPLIEDLLARGWKLSYDFAGRPGARSDHLDTITLTRPQTDAGAAGKKGLLRRLFGAGAGAAADAGADWKDYQKDAALAALDERFRW